MQKIVKEDYKFVPVNPDPGFDAKHNQKVIEESIKKAQRMARLKGAEYKDQLRARTDAVAKYVKSIDNGETSSDVLKYFGRKEITRLRGEEIRQTILSKLSNAKNKEALTKAKLQATVSGRIS